MRFPVSVAFLAVPLFLFAAPGPADACTNFIVTKGASADGSVMITYSADSHTLYGDLRVLPPAVYPPGTMVDVVDWDTNKPMGRIKQAARTYGVVGLMNEYQVAIGETTFGGRKELVDPESIIDYGSLMWFALQRAKTAREAIEVMTSLTAEYGYASEGESFSISDPNEAWILEMVGKGKGGKGAIWVARRIPDGYVSGHANHPRIRQFPLDDPKNTLYSKDVIQFARDKGWFKGADAEFSFADTYYPPSFGGVRWCDSRVWAMFRRIAPSAKLPIEMINGTEGAEPLPLWIKPEKPLTARDVMELMRDHFEGTELDLSLGVGAGPFSLPYRWRPMLWEHQGQKYVHERATSTQQTGFSFVAQSRSWLPNPLGGILWFGVDDTFLTVYVPLYCGIREAPHAYAVGTGTFTRFSWDSAWWVFNFVSNWTYTRWSDMIKDVQAVQRELEGSFQSLQPEVEAAAKKLYDTSPELARDYLTTYSVKQADRTVTRWRTLGQDLFVKYLDGNVRDTQGKVLHPKYPDPWYKRIVDERGVQIRFKKFSTEKDED